MTTTEEKKPEQSRSRALDLEALRKQIETAVEQATKKLDEAEESGRGFRGRSLSRRPSPQGKSTLPDPAIKDWEIRQPEIGDPGKSPADPLDRDRDRVEQPEWNATQEGVGSNPATLRENLLTAQQTADQALENLAAALEGRLSHAFWSSTPPPDLTVIPTGPISSVDREPIRAPEHPEAIPPEDEGLTPLQARARRQRELTISKTPDYAAEIKQDRELHPAKWKKIDEDNRLAEEEARRIEESKQRRGASAEQLPAHTPPVHASQLPAHTTPGTGIQGPRTSKEVKQS